jgi:uncharacterized membrane protein YdjX (TVP38/TMEM64 family)
MKFLSSHPYGVFAVREHGYPRVHVGASASNLARVAHIARVGAQAAKSVPPLFPMFVLLAAGGVFGGTLWGLKGMLAGAGLGALAGYGVTRLPDADLSA